MFSPVGTKKIMLNNYRRSLSTGESVKNIISRGNSLDNISTNGNDSGSEDKIIIGSSLKRLKSLKSFSSADSTTSESKRQQRISKKGVYSSVRNHMELSKILKEDSVAGNAVRKVASAAIKFEKERDGVLISAFETSALDYDNFRMLLKRMFFLEFTDEEFIQVCEMFDIHDHHEVNGSEFVVVFTILSNILKNEKRKEHRERKEQDELKSKEKNDEIISKLKSNIDNSVDYNFTELDKNNAINKINTAAAKYDRTHHTAKSLKSFERAYMEPIEFRDCLKGTFDINLTPKELGALVLHYNDGEEGKVPCNTFIVSFLRYGYDYRLEQRSKQIQQTKATEEKLKKVEEIKTIKQLESLEIENKPDYNYTEQDTQSMLNKIKIAAKNYDKNHPSAVSLDGFNSKYLSPGAFRITLYRTFHIELTDKELGSVINMFDTNNNETVSTHDFLVHFIRVGYEERSKIRSNHIQYERSESLKEMEESEKKILQQWKIDNELFDPTKYKRKDYETAMRKITREAERYHSEHVSAPNLSVFNGSDMSVAEFREMIKRQLNIQLSYPEIAALLPLIGSKTKENMISTGEFVVKFKAIGWESRQQRRTKQLELINKKKEKEREELEKKKERLLKELNEVVDFNFSPSDRESAIKKMTKAAHKYDKNHSGSMSLDGFLGRSMEPGIFSRLLKTVLNVTLTGKELGAIVSIYDNDGDGQIDSAEFLSNFFFMQRECRNDVRAKSLERLKQKANDDKTSFMERERLKNSHETLKLKFNSTDETTLLPKLLHVGKKYAIDNASFLDQLKVFKGPAMNSTAFYQTFFRIFLTKLTYPEIGALMYRVNPKMYELNMMDGPNFITWLQKLGRICEDILLGYVDEKIITFEHLKFSEPPEPSSISSFKGSSPSSGLLPNISPQKRSQSANQSKKLFSPSAEVISSERSISRGVGGDESIESIIRYPSPPKTTGSIYTLSDDESYDPYIPYMIRSFHRELKSHKKFQKKFQQDQHNLHQEEEKDYETRKSPSMYIDSSNESIVSNITENSLRFSPINNSNFKSFNNNNNHNNHNDETKIQPMVSSILGINPWNEINTNGQPHHNKSKKRS